VFDENSAPAITAQLLLNLADQELANTSDSARLDAEVLLRFLCNWSPTDLLIRQLEVLDASVLHAFNQLIARRKKGEPIAYITGVREFWSRDYQVSPATLIPRPDTETLVARALELLAPGQQRTVLDLGCGCGNIAISIAMERPNCKVMGVDLVTEAVELAKQNAEQLHCKNLEIIQSDWFDNLANQSFDLIVANPPYIESSDPHLNVGDVRAEPRCALVSGADGLDDIRKIIAAASHYLKPGATLVLEHGWQQAVKIRQIFADNNYIDANTQQDLGNRDRITEGRRSL
jgi:release factor glutamine methyltransferase